MKVNLDKDDCVKLAKAIRRETVREHIYIVQQKESKEMKPSFWNMLPFIMLILLAVFAVIVMIMQTGG